MANEATQTLSEWKEEAYCRDMDTGLFYNEESTTAVKIAKSACAECIVIEQCLESALIKNESGVWGGTTTRERNKIRSKRLIA